MLKNSSNIDVKEFLADLKMFIDFGHIESLPYSQLKEIIKRHIKK